jgi:hypothetical protein
MFNLDDSVGADQLERDHFAAPRVTGIVQVLGRRCEDGAAGRTASASEKRQGTESREWICVGSASSMGN